MNITDITIQLSKRAKLIPGRNITYPNYMKNNGLTYLVEQEIYAIPLGRGAYNVHDLNSFQNSLLEVIQGAVIVKSDPFEQINDGLSLPESERIGRGHISVEGEVLKDEGFSILAHICGIGNPLSDKVLVDINPMPSEEYLKSILKKKAGENEEYQVFKAFSLKSLNDHCAMERLRKK
jgi:hypothetical protein